MDAAGAIARYTEVVDTLEIFDRSLSREAADPSVAGLASGLYSLSVVREEDAYVQAVVAAGIAAGRIDAPSIDQARNATLRRSIAVDDFRSAVGTDNAGLADAVVGPDVDNRDLLAQVVLGRGAAGLPLQVSGPDWERASSAVEDRDAATSEQLRGQLQEQAGALQQAARNGAGVASVILLLALMAGAAVVFFVTRSLLRPLRLLRRSALDVAERRLPQAVRSLREGEAPDTTIVPTPITTREEIGQVARAFDQVHEQAVRLAAEQAGLRVGVQLDLREPVAALPGAGRAPAAPHRAAGELRGGPGGALQPLPARPPRDAHAPQLGEPAGALGHRPLAGGAAARCRWSTCCAPPPPRWSSTSASTSRRRPRPSCWAGRRATSCTSSPSCSRTPPRSPRPTPACGCRRRRTATAPCSSRSSTPVSA